MDTVNLYSDEILPSNEDLTPTFYDVLEDSINSSINVNKQEEDTDFEIILSSNDFILVYDNRFILNRQSIEMEAIRYLNNCYNNLVLSNYDSNLLIDYLQNYVDMCRQYPIIADITSHMIINKVK
jgi:hypothetical protein